MQRQIGRFFRDLLHYAMNLGFETVLGNFPPGILFGTFTKCPKIKTHRTFSQSLS